MKNISLLLLSSIGMLFFANCTNTKTEVKPNILFLSIDDLRPALGAFGDDLAITPNIDRFAEEAITFRQTFCQAAVCAPSRASLMTGLRPDSTRVWHLGDKFREINPATVTMPQHFSKHGYYTVNLGKIFHNYMPDSISWDEPDLRPARYKQQDWLGRDGETFYISEEVAKSQVIKRDSLLKLRPVRYADGWNTGPAWENADVHDTMYYDGSQLELTKKTLDRIVKADKPFYMGLGFFRPHLPFTVPKKYWDMYEKDLLEAAANPFIPVGAPAWTMNSMYELRHYDGFQHIGHPNSDFVMNQDTARILKHGYYASVSYVDELFGQLVDHLKSLGIYDNTIIVLWGDHGWKLGDHNSWGKMTNYAIDLQVPLIIRNPYQENQGKETQSLTELVDLFPTICEMANIEVPDYTQGVSLVQIMQNTDVKLKTAALSQFHRRPQHAADGGRYMGYSMVTEAYHFIEWYQWDDAKGKRGALMATELFDRVKDPTEKFNLATSEESSEKVTELSKALELAWAESLL